MCFERFGITKTTMEDVARAARMSRATVYRHFSDRESLIMASVTRRARMNIEPARSYIANCRTLEDKIVEGIGHNVRRGRRDPMVHLLVSPEEMTLSTQLLWRSGTAIDLTYELWAPSSPKRRCSVRCARTSTCDCFASESPRSRSPTSARPTVPTTH